MSRPPRLEDSSYIGHQSYFLTVCCHHRQSIFVRPEVVDSVLQQFFHAARERDFAITAYCFMPDHVHALVAGESEQSDLPSFVSLAKQRSGYYFKRAERTPLWQQGYFDRVLRSDEPKLAVIRYIVSHPIRAGMVVRPEQYPYWGSQVYSREELLGALSWP